ncbi:MAG: PAS domain S-box protein [Candidatus Rokubacteria bacterium]|nr:PAS domain S-box protein [Candidatus Rokubacteria bacterium]
MELDTLLTNTADGVCAIDGDGKIVLWNRAAEKILGYSAREVVGRPCCEVFVGRDAAGNRLCYQGCHVMTQVKRGELVQHFDMATRTKAGKPVWLDISIVVVPGGRRELSTTVHLFRDVTAAHEIEALVRERLAQAVPQSTDGGGPALELTRRELEILRLMAGGANTRAIAERLHVSPATVRNHVQNILGKLGVHSRLEAAAYANRHRLL